MNCYVFFENPLCTRRQRQPSVCSSDGSTMSVNEASISDLFVPYDRIRLESLLGRGHFSQVYKAQYRSRVSRTWFTTAVKVLKAERANRNEETEKFLSEAAIMRKFDHENLLNVIAISISPSGLPMMVLPYMDMGDLRAFVSDPKRELRVIELLHFARQVLNGMCYLTRLRYVHRDLAARNCMVASDGRVKVADFGLTIPCTGYSWRHVTETKLPIKWMAIESLIDNRIFNEKTDVWSFGILLWELMTRGAVPYANVENQSLRSTLQSGLRLCPPYQSPKDIYAFMLACWQTDPRRRPSFYKLHSKLCALLSLHNQPRSPTDIYFVNVLPVKSFTLLET